jgi:RimJ/RimL family protein N-acetyltransferase
VTAAPRIETERLVLRPHVMADFPAFAAFFASDASRYVGGPLTLTRCWNGFASDVGAWELMGFGAWGVEEKASGTFVGQVGLNKPPYFPEREIGWILMTEFEGRGYAAEAARAARAYAYGTLGWTTAVSYVDPENARSIALARRLGCVIDPDAVSYDPGDHVFRHPAPAALA